MLICLRRRTEGPRKEEEEERLMADPLPSRTLQSPLATLSHPTLTWPEVTPTLSTPWDLLLPTWGLHLQQQQQPQPYDLPHCIPPYRPSTIPTEAWTSWLPGTI